MGICSATLSGIALDCGNIGGLKNIWISQFSNIDNIQIGSLYKLAETSNYYDNGGSTVAIYLSPLDYENYKNKDIRFYGEYDNTIYNIILDKSKISYHYGDMAILLDLTDNRDIFLGVIDYVNYAFVSIELSEKSDEFISVSTLGDFMKFSFRKGNASFISTINKDDKQGTSFVNTEINLQFNKMDKQKRFEIINLLKENVYVIIQDNNNTYWFVGGDSYVYLSETIGETGVTKGDANNYKIKLVSETKVLPYEISEEQILLISLR